MISFLLSTTFAIPFFLFFKLIKLKFLTALADFNKLFEFFLRGLYKWAVHREYILCYRLDSYVPTSFTRVSKHLN